MNLIAVSNERGEIVNADLLAAAESVHRQLRPHLPAAYVARMKEIFAGGAEMAVAEEAGRVVGLTVFRILEKTFTARELYCDDLVTDEGRRSMGVGASLIGYLERIARERGCQHLALDSGTQRQEAHRFYFREGLPITAFHFSRKL